MSAKKKHSTEGDAAPAPEQHPTALEELEQRLESAEKAAGEAKDQALRTLAEFQNYKKRVTQERQAWRAEALADVALHLVPLADNLERGIAAAEQAQDVAAVVEGMKLIQRQFETVLGQMGVQPIDATGKLFDPALHEAIVATETEECPADTVLEELQRGYVLDGKVIRPARVRVSKSSAVAGAPND